MQLVQSRLLVHRFAEAYDFYADVLGLTPQRRQRDGAYEKLSFPRGDAAIALQARRDMESVVPLGEGDRSLIVIRVDDVDRLAEELAARGAAFVSPPRAELGRLRAAYLRDPEGNLIELQTW